ncbi:2'-5' RNA ligase family protein [Chitinophaga sp. G-6-1-13]|uniref:2'-5' RNA ligase family protein n=1 Tax=Chitinophaga fulva TaxID=2728842 RepID=A0A848GCU2_9BACT|nr:2'-5' RNA ligase family protein [Chitinophaga fulva]NML35776.1 2'-5' RNA ligase family protein [Chitinophaga fulva]
MQRVNYAQLSLFSIYEYFLLLSPGPGIVRKVAAMKSRLAAMIRIPPYNLGSIAHISLMKFSRTEDDQAIIQRVTRAVEGFSEFRVQLDGADIFHHGRTATLMLQPVDSDAITSLHGIITVAFNHHRSIRPHITIARNVAHEELLKVNLHDFDCHDSFCCDKVTILKKAVEAPHYEVLQEVPLFSEKFIDTTVFMKADGIPFPAAIDRRRIP